MTHVLTGRHELVVEGAANDAGVTIAFRDGPRRGPIGVPP
jgi:hypothetical protein